MGATHGCMGHVQARGRVWEGSLAWSCHRTNCVFGQAPILSLSFFIYKEKTLCLAGSLPGLHEMMDVNHLGSWHSAPGGFPKWGQVLSLCVCARSPGTLSANPSFPFSAPKVR